MVLFWILFHLIILSLLVLDLKVLNRGSRELSTRQALGWTAMWILLACAFAVGVYLWRGPDQAMSFAAGYLIELSLSVDNLFVFLALFSSFSVPHQYQHRVLAWGIVGAVVMRIVFILAGVSLIHQFRWLTYLLGAFLVYLGVRFALQRQGEMHLPGNRTLNLLRRVIPFTSKYQEDRFIVRQDGKLIGTPLLMVLLAIETTDVLFALDSIPAVLAISQDRFIVYTSNILAILGLRSMYFALAKVINLFHYLKYGLAAILMFTGGKILIASVYHVPVEAALSVVLGILMVSIFASFLQGRPAVASAAGKCSQ